MYDWLEVALGSQSQGYMTCQSVRHGNVGERFHNKLVNPTPTSQKKHKVNIFVLGKLGCSCTSQNETETPLCSRVRANKQRVITLLVNVTLLLTVLASIVFMDSLQTDKKKFVDDVAKVELQTLQISQRCGFDLFAYIWRNTRFQKENILISLLTK